MISIGLDLGTGFVKCISDFGKIRFPSLYASKIVSEFSSEKKHLLEYLGWEASKRLGQKNFEFVTPIKKGRPIERYQHYIGLLVDAAVKQTFTLNKGITTSDEISLTVGLPFHGKTDVPFLKKSIQKIINPKILTIVPQAFGTLVDVGMASGLVVNIGQGTTEFVVFENKIPIDGKSVLTASSMITEEISQFSHLKTDELHNNKSLCEKFAKQLVNSLRDSIIDYVDEYNQKDNIIIAGGGVMIPGVRENLIKILKDYTVKIPPDPNFSNANGLYKTAKFKSKKR